MKIFAAQKEDIHQGWVWVPNQSLPTRSIVKITNLRNNKNIYCEALQIDPSFLNQYNQPPRNFIEDPSNSIVMGSWFRAKLGNLETKSDAILTIKECSSFWSKYKASADHPQIVVRMAANLGMIGLVLGLIGLILGVISLSKECIFRLF